MSRLRSNAPLHRDESNPAGESPAGFDHESTHLCLLLEDFFDGGLRSIERSLRIGVIIDDAIHGAADRLRDFVNVFGTDVPRGRLDILHVHVKERELLGNLGLAHPLDGLHKTGLGEPFIGLGEHESNEIPGDDLVLLRLVLVHTPRPSVDHRVGLRGIDLRADRRP